MAIESITSTTGVTNVLEHRDKSHLISAADQIDVDFSTFLDFTWNPRMSVEQ